MSTSKFQTVFHFKYSMSMKISQHDIAVLCLRVWLENQCVNLKIAHLSFFFWLISYIKNDRFQNIKKIMTTIVIEVDTLSIILKVIS